MKRKILIGVNGWGRGHAIRCDVIGHQLIKLGYDIKFLTDFQGYDYLIKQYASSQVIKAGSYRPIIFGESVSPPLNVIATILFKLFRLPYIANKAMQFIEDWQPDVIISDSELITGKFIKKLELPTIYLSSLSFLKYCQLPLKFSILRSLYVYILNWVLSECTTANLIILSKMSTLQLKQNVEDNVHMFDVFLRPEFERYNWKRQGTHILVYLRGAYIKSVLLELEIVGSKLNKKIFVYGAEGKRDTDYLIFKPISSQNFMRHMFDADYVICTSGNQIVGELAYLGVPTLLIPELGQFEQEVNADLACRYYKNMAKANLKTVKANEIITKLRSLKVKPHSYIMEDRQKAVDLIVDFIENSCSV